ncbi:kininogen-1 isoform X2 [Betta splendens]|uniref:Kininogen-1 isoform X2 n=1 Tax=Betta splendens TaxID=158456 RepID=A0A6P7M911_BETSP|nr:kininogen-1 isoform X2 [Betta splendens]
MRSRVALCALALLCLHSSVFGQVVDVQPGVLIFCDDPSVEKAVSSAVTKFNGKLTSGHTLALFQILTASKSENGANSVYSLQFTTRRSDCLAEDRKPWSDCNYLPYGHKAPISCNATVNMSDTEADTKQVDCLVDHVTPDKAPCLGCPREIDENSEDIRVPLSASISKYNSMSTHTHLFTLNNLGPVTQQVVAGLRYKMSFDMRKTKCAKAEHKDLNELCVLDGEKAEFVTCNSIVDVAPWRFENPEVQLECADGEMPVSFSRRRPPGWSPLRSILRETPPSFKKPTAAPPVAPSAASPKKESSEEDNTGSKHTPPTAAAEELKKNPFHCPSKPWKPWSPVEPPPPGAPTQASTTATAAPPADGQA